jgi:DNA-binding GntR family transcriptional regulator
MAVRLGAEPISPLTLVDRVHQRLWDWILSGRLQPGDWLRIQEIARTLKVSDTPIREALIRLQQSGLVETIPHVGTRVRRFTRQDIEESFDLREALECFALQQAGLRVPAATLARLKQQLLAADAALDAGSTAEAVAADVALHMELIRAAGNSRILALFATLLDQVRMFAGFGNRTPEGPRRFLQMHLRIVDLLMKRDLARAVRLMRDHMQLAKENSLRGYFGGKPPTSPSGDGDGRVRRARRAGRAVGVSVRRPMGKSVDRKRGIVARLSNKEEGNA